MKSGLATLLIISATLAIEPAFAENNAAHQKFEQRMENVGVAPLCKIHDLTDKEREALEFLYTYMSDPDIGAYSPEFFLENVRSSLKAKDEMPWGKDVPNREWRHFVLPLRVNNESLDMSRPLFYDELKERVRGMSMEDAILEVNHWCHEKATYRPSDARTSSPLSTVSQAIGRCGEESTFTVAALRSVGIPARQVYTPRWAHTDDNHAWVEAWANGRWYFLGACEPEPVLNLAWFNAPASRGILMSTNVYGDYEGPEEVLSKNDIVTTINVTSNYAPVRVGKVLVKDIDGKPVSDATVRFGVYNYAEFYPVGIKRTDSKGEASLTTGLGDMVVWATDGKRYGMSKLEGNAKTPVTIVLDRKPGQESTIELDLTPPPVRPIETFATDVQKEANAHRLAYEDSIRNVYQSTFADSLATTNIASRLNVEATRLYRILKDSRGNHSNIVKALESLVPEKRLTALAMLENVSEKDRRDIPLDVIVSHVETFEYDPSLDIDFQNKYLLNPRIENERLTSYRTPLRGMFTKSEIGAFTDNPRLLEQWVQSNIEDDSRWNPLNFRMDPLAVASLGKANPLGKKIFFVAAARSLGIPARIDLVRGEAQYADSAMNWVDVLREDETETTAKDVPIGKLRLTFDPGDYLKDPAYYSNFTISRVKDGQPKLLEYDEGATLSQLFSNAAEIEAGDYMMVTGQRLADGGVLAKVDFFNVAEGEEKTLPLVIRQDPTAVSVIGSLNAEDLYHDRATGKEKSILSTTGRGYYVLGIVRKGHEPSLHTLNDIAQLKAEFEKRGEKLLILTENSDGSLGGFNLSAPMPDNTVTGMDIDGAILNEIKTSLNLKTDELPVFVIADTFNRIVFVSQGYTIGLGERLLRTLQKL